MATGDSLWAAGSITVPGSTGSVAYTPAEFAGRTPSMLVFYGTNWLTEDAVVTSNGLGLFRGMAAPKWDDASLIQNAACVVTTPYGNAHVTDTGYAIRMSDTSGSFSSYLYVAAVTSFDAGGFTLNWNIATAGGYKVVYVALFEIENIAAFIGTYNGSSYNPGWKAGSSLLHGAWGGPAVGGDDRTQEFYGGAAYPGTTDYNWAGCGATVFSFPTSISSQSLVELWAGINPSTLITSGGHFTGPFLVSSNITAWPSGGGNSFVIGGDSDDGGMVVWWDDENSWCFFQDPAQANGALSTKTGLTFAPGIILGYTISNEPSEQSVLDGAIGFGIATADFQWCATVDGGGDSGSQGSFQSFQRAIADCVDGTNVHTATAELTGDGFILTTEEDSATADRVVWHAFGHPDSAILPQLYRWWRARDEYVIA